MSHIDAHAQFQGMPGFILKWLAVFFLWKCGSACLLNLSTLKPIYFKFYEISKMEN